MIFIPQPDVNAAFADAIQEYRQNGDIAALLDRMKALSLATEPEALIAASAPYHDLPEVVIPVYERIVTARPDDAQSMVILANAYWLTGRGADGTTQRPPSTKSALQPYTLGGSAL